MVASLSPISLYIHIPFCAHLCPYCSFYKTQHNKEEETLFIKALTTEIEWYKNTFPNLPLHTLFFGGGTPNTLSLESVNTLFDALHTSFNIQKNSEITIECNPEWVNEEWIKTVKKWGCNRISLGAQSFHQDDQTFLGRKHTNKHVHNSINLIKKIGIHNFNIDLMFSLKNETKTTLEENIQAAIKLNPTHLSYYALNIEKNTPFHKKNTQPLHSELELIHYEYIKKKLKENHFNQYEISAFSKKGFPCNHNLSYWQYKPYIGIGPSAHSFFNNKRYKNTSNLKKYIANPLPNIKKTKKESKQTQIENFLLCTLRLTQGFSKQEFEKNFNIPIQSHFKYNLEKLKKNNLLKENKTHIKTTKKGQQLLNHVLLELVS